MKTIIQAAIAAAVLSVAAAGAAFAAEECCCKDKDGKMACCDKAKGTAPKTPQNGEPQHQH